MIQRLILVSRCLKKFENITNPFAVFKVPGDKTRENYYTELIIIIILFIFAFYYRVIGFWYYKINNVLLLKWKISFQLC